MEIKTRKIIVAKLSKEYKKSRRIKKKLLLDELIRLTGYNRSYARRVLRKPTKVKQQHRNRISKYSLVLGVLKKLWYLSNFSTGKRLMPLIPILLASLQRHQELKVKMWEKRLLLKISPATCNRLLKGERRKLGIKSRSGTKPGSLLKNQIPIHTWFDWDNTKPGFLEIDTVHHNGGNPSGEYIHTLDTQDVATGWNECSALMGRGETGLVKALNEIRERLSFKLLGIDFDSGGEFVNWHLVRYCKGNKISYTRARESYSNDQPYIEQQNYSVVRTFVGYKRLDSWKQLELLNKLYLKLSDYQNFFQSVMRLKEKVRNGAHVTRRYGKAKTAHQRVLESPDIPEEVKLQLTERFLDLNPRKLLLEINVLAKKVNS